MNESYKHDDSYLTSLPPVPRLLLLPSWLLLLLPLQLLHRHLQIIIYSSLSLISSIAAMNESQKHDDSYLCSLLPVPRLLLLPP